MQQVFVEVKFDNLDDAETFHDAIREYLDEYRERMGTVREVNTGIQDIE